MSEVSTSIPPKTYVPPQSTPIFIEFPPECNGKNSLDNNRCPQNKLERVPKKDGFGTATNPNDTEPAQLMAYRVPSGKEIIAGALLIKELLRVLNDAAIAGKNLWETLTDWVGTKDNLSDSEKVQVTQLGNILAKQMTAKQMAAKQAD